MKMQRKEQRKCTQWWEIASHAFEPTGSALAILIIPVCIFCSLFLLFCPLVLAATICFSPFATLQSTVCRTLMCSTVGANGSVCRKVLQQDGEQHAFFMMALPCCTKCGHDGNARQVVGGIACLAKQLLSIVICNKNQDEGSFAS